MAWRCFFQTEKVIFVFGYPHIFRSHVKKSVSREKTLRDFFSMEDLRQLCIELCGSVAVELEKMHCAVLKEIMLCILIV